MIPEDGLSFNEIAALGAKAARGAGLGWGHAEDLGTAARWLARRDLPWETALCRLLEAPDAALRASRLAELADWVAHAPAGQQRAVEDIAEVIWLPPLISAAIFGRACGVVVRGPGSTIRLSSDGGMAREGHDVAGPLTLEATASEPVPEEELRRRPGPASPDALARLSAFADLTLVPASAASRGGAGAAGTDND